jgi:hypothetical protein
VPTMTSRTRFATRMYQGVNGGCTGGRVAGHVGVALLSARPCAIHLVARPFAAGREHQTVILAEDARDLLAER